MSTQFSTRSWVVFLACVVSTLIGAHGGANAAKTGEGNNSLASGSWSIQFAIDKDFDFISYEGATISAKYHFSDKSAIRGGLSLRGSTEDSESALIIIPADSILKESKSDQNSVSVGLKTLFLFYPSPQKEVNVFLGAGPILTYSRDKKNEGGDSATRRSWAIGIAAAFGVEWFATKSISILSEYGGSFEYETHLYKGKYDGRESKTEIDRFEMSTLSVKLGVSFYF